MPFQNCGFVSGFIGQSVETAFAGAAVFDEAGLLELGEMRGNRALPHGQNLLQLGDGELLGTQKKQNAQAVGVGDDAENFYYGWHFGS